MNVLFKAAVAAVGLGIAALPLQAQEKPGTILVLDASGSMWGQIDGVNKITIARDVVADILADFPADQNLGFVTYGHRERGQCTDIQTVIEPAPGTAGEIIKIVNELNPRGMTPMTDAVIAAAQALRHTEQAATVILVSDGIETCNPDPCAAARALSEAGIDFTAHVIGFDVRGEAEALMQMQCIADETGGRFLTADNAQELSEALQQVVAAPVVPAEPEPAALGQLTLMAVLDAEGGTQVTDRVEWTVSGAAGEGTAVENPSVFTLPSGVYTISGYHTVFEQEQSAQLTFMATSDRTYTMVFKTPTPTVSLVAPESVPAGSVAEIGWHGPDANNDNIQIAEVGGRYLHYAYTRSGNPVQLQMPAKPGTYELRYSLRDNEVIHTQPIEVTAIELGLIAPETAPAGSVVEIGWLGPDANNDNIQIAEVGGRYLHYTYTRSGNPVKLQMPAKPGTYELRYSFRDNEVIHTQPIEVTEVDVSLIAPESAPAGSVVEIGWLGPDANNDNIQLAEVGGKYLHYAYTRSGNPVKLQMPAQPGAYELRYSFRDREVIHSQPINVTPIELGFIAPETAVAGSVVEIGWVGPGANNDNIQIAEVGGKHLHYAYTRSGNPVKLRMPEKPGTYELRYSFRDREVIFTRLITVTAAP